MSYILPFIILFCLFGLGIPIAFSMLGFSFLYILSTPHVPLILLAQKMVYGINSFPLMAVPFFILAAELMNTGGITDRIFRFASVLVGHLIGGLGHVNVVASMIFAGMSGSAVADAAGLGQVEIKAMRKAGFDDEFSAAVTAASSTIGPIIPPSIPMVVYGSMVGVSVGRLLLGGIIPGILMGLGLMVVVYVLARKRKYPTLPRPSASEVLESFVSALFPLLTPALLLGGIISGIVTPTESAAIACAYAFVLSVLVYREISLRQLGTILVKVGTECAIVLFIVAAASTVGVVVIRMHLAQEMTQAIFAFTQNPYMVLLFLNILLLFLGCFLEALSILIILSPLLMPLVTALGVDPVHFGVVMVVNLMIGLITPPVGICMYITCRLADVTTMQFAREIVPFLGILIGVLFLITYIPGLVLFVPNLVLGK